jgi:hypothetical protein
VHARALYVERTITDFDMESACMLIMTPLVGAVKRESERNREMIASARRAFQHLGLDFTAQSVNHRLLII